MYLIDFVRATNFNIRISPTLCEQYICKLIKEKLSTEGRLDLHMKINQHGTDRTLLQNKASYYRIIDITC